MWYLLLITSLVVSSISEQPVDNKPELESLESGEPDSLGNEASRDYDKEFYTFTAPEEEFSDPYFKVETAFDQQNSTAPVIIVMEPEEEDLEESILDIQQQSLNSSTEIITIDKEINMEELDEEGNETCTTVESCAAR